MVKLPLYISYVLENGDGNPVQWNLSVPYLDEHLMTVSLFKDSFHVAILGWDNDAGFEFKKDDSIDMVDDVRDNLMKRHHSLKYIIKYVFSL